MKMVIMHRIGKGIDMGIIVIYNEDLGGKDIKERATRIERKVRNLRPGTSTQVNFIHTGRLLPEELAMAEINTIIKGIEEWKYG